MGAGAAHETQSTDRELPRVLCSLPRNLHPGALASCFHTDRGEMDPFPPQELLWYKGEDAWSPASSAHTVHSQPSQLWQTGRHPKGLLYSLLVHLSTPDKATQQTPSKPKRPVVLPHLFLGCTLMAYPQCTSRQPQTAAGRTVLSSLVLPLVGL